MPFFSSVRAINEAAFKAAYGTLGGQSVYVNTEDGHRRRVQRAKTVKGDLYVRPVNLIGDEEWIGPLAWGQIVQEV